MVHGSVLDELLVDELVNQSDVIVHLAAAVGVKLIIEQPLRSFTTNIRGSEIVIEAAHRYRRKILVASTSEIYGKNGVEPLAEDADRHLGATTVARWAYSTAKAVDEILAYSFHRERGCRRSSCASSTPWARARAPPTGWSSPGWCTRRCAASR